MLIQSVYEFFRNQTDQLISLFSERLIGISNIYHKSKSIAKIDQLINNLLFNNLLLEFLAPTVSNILYPTLYLFIVNMLYRARFSINCRNYFKRPNFYCQNYFKRPILLGGHLICLVKHHLLWK